MIISLYLFVVSLTIVNPYVWQNARKSVALPGLNKENVTETLAVFQTLTFIAIAMLPRRDITVSEQAEYEVLLTMPVTMQEYMLGRSLHLITQSVLVQSVFLVPARRMLRVFRVRYLDIARAFITLDPLKDSQEYLFKCNVPAGLHFPFQLF